ncbi:rhodanese-like domain-containing protein [Thermodesulfobacteriota bacterium B35]
MKGWIAAIVMGIALWSATIVGAADLNYVDATQFKQWLAEKRPLILADIQKLPDYRKHHFYGAIGTTAYPVKSDADRSKLAAVVEMFRKTGNMVVIIGPRGKASARRAFVFLVEQGIPGDKIVILTGGIHDWPDREMLLDIAGGCA